MNIKICGITNEVEISMIDELGVPFGGLWLNIPKGKYNLTEDEFRILTNIRTQTLRFIWVTFENSFQIIKKLIQTTSLYGIQLHGFQLPSLVKEIKCEFQQSIKIFKVLHIQKDKCIEEEFIDRYLSAGVDYFILDTYLSKDQIGSTGVALSNNSINKLVPAKIDNTKVMIAGGINQHNICNIFDSYKPFGVDIDSSARKDGEISKECISGILNNLKFTI